MTHILLGIVLAFADIVVAAWHLVTGRKRATYTARIDIAAPRHAVWDLLVRPDITYTRSGLRTVTTPLAGNPDVVTATLAVKGKQFATMGMQYIERLPAERLVVRYLPELSSNPALMGEDDIVAMHLADTPTGGTRFVTTRTLTHKKPGTRITAPIGVRQAVWLVKTQAELEAAHPEHQPSTAMTLGIHAFWALAAFATFAYAFGWREALLLMVIIAVHEIGHALAMLHYGLGVHLISFVPFFGGMAVPKRLPESEWQRGVIALMGVGASLPVVLALLWLGRANGSQPLVHAAAVFAFVNAFNLIPFPGIDGGIVCNMLLRKIHPAIGHLASWMMLAIAVAAVVAFDPKDPILWGLLAFMLVALVQTSSLKVDDHFRPMRWPGSLALLALFLGLCAAYAWACISAADLEIAMKAARAR